MKLFPSFEPWNTAPSNFLEASVVHLGLGMNLISDSTILYKSPKSKPTKQVEAVDLYVVNEDPSEINGARLTTSAIGLAVT